MDNKIKIKIGEFSKLCQVTVKTLRHYESLGLLVPNEVDDWTGYRYYDTSQLYQMNGIIYMKKLGFSLEEILDIFDQGLQMPTKEMILEKEKQCSDDINKLMWRQKELARLESMLQKEDKIMKKIFEKTLPSRIFATHRQKIDSYQDLFELCPNVIGAEMLRLGCECPEPQYCFTVEYQEEYGKDIDIEYFEAVKEMGTDTDIIKFKTLPEVPVALCINHMGAYEKLPETFAQLFSYAEAHGYQIADRPRFSYIDGVWNKDSEDQWLTQIELPVKK